MHANWRIAGAFLAGFALAELPAAAQVGETPKSPTHYTADLDQSGYLDSIELMRIIQFSNTDYHCATEDEFTEDGYATGPGYNGECLRHMSDYNPPDGAINIQELVRVYNAFRLGYSMCEASADGICLEQLDDSRMTTPSITEGGFGTIEVALTEIPSEPILIPGFSDEKLICSGTSFGADESALEFRVIYIQVKPNNTRYDSRSYMAQYGGDGFFFNFGVNLVDDDAPTGVHSADSNSDARIDIDELLRIIQLYNSQGFSCALEGVTTEDGFAPDQGPYTCGLHDADYNNVPWAISLDELMRVIQLYNSGGYTFCPTNEDSDDGYCPGT